MESEKKYKNTQNMQIKNVNDFTNKPVRVLGTIMSFDSPKGQIDDGTGILDFELDSNAYMFEEDEKLLKKIIKSTKKSVRIHGFLFVSKKPILKVKFIIDLRKLNLDLYLKVRNLKEKFTWETNQKN